MHANLPGPRIKLALFRLAVPFGLVASCARNQRTTQSTQKPGDNIMSLRALGLSPYCDVGKLFTPDKSLIVTQASYREASRR